MNNLEVYISSFEEYLKGNSFKGEPSSLFDAANYIMQLGGKRLRPAMVLMACDAFQSSFKEALPAALAIEVFHNFTLVHDDIMDAAPLRRGKPTVHKKWDEPTAILCGDMMMFEASIFLQNLPDAIFREVLTMFNRTAIEVCRGQQLDMLFESRNDVCISEYLDMITLKTSVLLGCSFYIGALTGGASKEDSQMFYEFGKNIGIAFQLQDDILDAFAEDPEAFGKQVGGDILSNKKTYLLLTALQNANQSQKEKLNQCISDKDFEAPAKISIMKELFVATGAKSEAEIAQQQFYTNALAIIDQLKLTDEKKSGLRQFAFMVMNRKK